MYNVFIKMYTYMYVDETTTKTTTTTTTTTVKRLAGESYIILFRRGFFYLRYPHAFRAQNKGYAITAHILYTMSNPTTFYNPHPRTISVYSRLLIQCLHTHTIHTQIYILTRIVCTQLFTRKLDEGYTRGSHIREYNNKNTYIYIYVL